MTRRERLTATLTTKPVDRPAVNFYEIGGFRIDPADPGPFNIYNDPSWQPLLKLAEEKTDLIRMRSPVRDRSHEFYEPTKKAPDSPRDEFFTTDKYLQKSCQYTRTTLKIAGKTMTSLIHRSPDVDTIWVDEYLLKSTDDLETYLQLPDEVFAEDIDVSKMLEEDEKLSNDGIIMVDTEDPIGAAACLLNMEDFTITAWKHQNLFHRLLEKISRYIYTRTEKTAQAFPSHLWRICGSEYATEPFLPPHLFQEYVVRYTSPMVTTIQKYGGFARIHCHGKIRAVLDYIIQMQPDALDPIEPPPQGDIELDYVRRKYGKDLVLFGNIEVSDLENTTPADFEKIAIKTLRDGTAGTGRGFVLMPSASPYGRKITSQTLTNYETLLRLATNFRC